MSERNGEQNATRSVLAVTARPLPDGVLAIATSLGLIGSTLIAMYAHEHWRIGLACVTLAAFGAWGIFDRSSIRPRWLSIVARAGTAIIGIFAAFLLLFIVLEFALRNIKP